MNYPRRRGLLPATLLALLLALGAMALWAMLFGVATNVIRTTLLRSRTSQQLVLTADGQPLLRLWQAPYVKTVLRTLDGQAVQDDRSLLVQDETAQNTELPGPADTPSPRREWALRIRSFRVVRPEPAYWYLVQDEQPRSLGYFEGYDPESKRLLGYMGLKGFRVTMPPADERLVLEERWFGGGTLAPSQYSPQAEPNSFGGWNAIGPLLVVSDGTLYRFDLGAQTVNKIPMPGRVISVGTTAEPMAVSDDRRMVFKTRLVVRLADQLLVRDLDGQALETIHLPPELRDARFTLFDTTGDEWVAVKNFNGGWHRPTDIYWFEPGGAMTRHEQVLLDTTPAPDPRGEAILMAAMLPAPLPWTLSAWIARPWEMDEDGTMRVRSIEQTIAYNWPAFIVVCLVSIIAAAVCYRRERRLHGRQGALWAFLVFLFGLPGLVGYLTHRRWPAVEACPACRVPVPRDRARCPACESAFPAPELRGNEVFG